MLFREVLRSDLNKVNEFVEAVFYEFIAFEFTSKGVENFRNSIKPKVLEKSIEDSKCFLIGCFDENEILGIIAVKNYSHINLLFVHKKHHKKGIARKLFKRALRKSMNLFPNIRRITVNSSLYAVEVYKKFGFKVLKEKEFKDGIAFIPMEINFSIRKAKCEDEELAFNLAKDTLNWMNEKNIEYLKNPLETIYDMKNEFKKDFEYNNFYFLEVNSKVAGAFKLSFDNMFYMNKNYNYAYIKYLFIIKTWFGYGIGKFLFEKIRGILLSNDITKIRISCDTKHKKLRNYYEIEKFKKIDEKKIFLSYKNTLNLSLFELDFENISKNLKNNNLYNNFAYYYDSYVNYFKDDIPIYLKYVKENTKVLEIGCGTGRILKAVLSKDCEVVGVDTSKSMLNIANKRLAYYINKNKLKLINTDLSEKTLNCKFDRVFITFYTFNYLLIDKKRFKMLKHIYSMLNDKGIVVVDLFYPKSFRDLNIHNKWFKKKIYYNEEIIDLEDKRKLIGDLEERIQIFNRNDERETLITYRRFFNEEDIKSTFEYLGFSNIYMQKGYEVYSNIKSNEKHSNNYIIVAQK
jgi:ubiquinone/menaquinone biosynthesis C-methylase UbiE/GNAT superfamily N-acetyltransferase